MDVVIFFPELESYNPDRQVLMVSEEKCPPYRAVSK